MQTDSYMVNDRRISRDDRHAIFSLRVHAAESSFATTPSGPEGNGQQYVCSSNVFLRQDKHLNKLQYWWTTLVHSASRFRFWEPFIYTRTVHLDVLRFAEYSSVTPYSPADADF